MLTFAIGDIHGCARLLEALLARIDLAAAGERYRVVCLGDYVDRGPASAEVVALLREGQARRGRDDFVCLKGNHEDMLLRAAYDLAGEAQWFANGAADTLSSFGFERARDLPIDVIAWVESCPIVFEDAWRCYVHAGLSPARARYDQSDDDRLWIREPFLSRDHDFGRYVVHGHTPRADGLPEVRAHRANLDTAAVYGGPLTAGIFVDGAPRPAGFVRVSRAELSGNVE